MIPFLPTTLVFQCSICASLLLNSLSSGKRLIFFLFSPLKGFFRVLPVLIRWVFPAADFFPLFLLPICPPPGFFFRGRLLGKVGFLHPPKTCSCVSESFSGFRPSRKGVNLTQQFPSTPLLHVGQPLETSFLKSPWVLTFSLLVGKTPPLFVWAPDAGTMGNVRRLALSRGTEGTFGCPLFSTPSIHAEPSDLGTGTPRAVRIFRAVFVLSGGPLRLSSSKNRLTFFFLRFFQRWFPLPPTRGITLPAAPLR